MYLCRSPWENTKLPCSPFKPQYWDRPNSKAIPKARPPLCVGSNLQSFAADMACPWAGLPPWGARGVAWDWLGLHQGPRPPPTAPLGTTPQPGLGGAMPWCPQAFEPMAALRYVGPHGTSPQAAVPKGLGCPWLAPMPHAGGGVVVME